MFSYILKSSFIWQPYSYSAVNMFIWGVILFEKWSQACSIYHILFFTRKLQPCKIRHFAQAGSGETLTFSLQKQIMKGRLTQVKLSYFWHSLLLSQAQVENKWDIVVSLAEKNYLKNFCILYKYHWQRKLCVHLCNGGIYIKGVIWV